jgi:hypothetical protein
MLQFSVLWPEDVLSVWFDGLVIQELDVIASNHGARPIKTTLIASRCLFSFAYLKKNILCVVLLRLFLRSFKLLEYLMFMR